MAKRLITCIPNYSEGRRSEVIEEIVEPFRRTRGCWLLDYRADADHNRLVVSLVGEFAPIQEALLASAKVAIAKIDLQHHQGGHPRVGAVDVIPFVPLKNVTMDHCVELAHTFGHTYHRETGVPVYFYEEAALRPERKRLEVIRRGQYEALRSEITQPERHPDVGEAQLHPTAGATVIGARKFLVAFNVNLATSDIEIAKEIARTVKAPSSGFAHVKAIGLPLKERGLVQVIRMEAKKWGIAVVETEVYGMIPAAALLDSASSYMQIADFDPNQVMELRLLEILGDYDV